MHRIKKVFVLYIIACCTLLCCTTSVVFAQSSFNELNKAFKNPGRKYGSAPLWVWNTDVDSATITRMLKEFKQNAFGGVFIHPRPGLITPYLSKQWLDLCSFTLKEAKKNDLDVWIYDEDSYPSGFGGGHVPDEMPESYNQGQMLQLQKAATLPDSAALYYLCLKKENGRFTDITKNLEAEKGKTGDYYFFKKTFYHNSDWYGGFSYVDLMVKGVTEKFIDVTMSPYERIFKKDFGKFVPGIFSDEPNIEVQDSNSVRWTPDLFTTFRAKWGYNLEPKLPLLLEESGDWKKVRHDYLATLLDLFIERWSKPFSAYAEQKKLEWTGHYWEHTWPNPVAGPDNMAMYAWHQRPGIDMLFNQFNESSPAAQFGNIRSVKELSSVANQLDKKRTLSETYGGGGWDLTFKDMKRLGDWEYVLGVNTLNQHLSYMNMKGARKYDYPQSFSYHNPWWPYYKSLNQYFARLSLALSSGVQKNKILIIEPTTTTWMYFNYAKPKQFIRDIGIRFQAFVTQLEKAQVEYDLGSENIIKEHGSIRDGKFVIGKSGYETVILPPGTENVDAATFQLLQDFATAGGKIVQFSPLKYIDGSANDSIGSFYKSNVTNLVTYDSLDANLIQQELNEETFSIDLDRPVQGNLFHHRRQLQDGQLIFLSNASLDQSVKRKLQAMGADVINMDLFTGENSRYPNQKKGNSVEVAFDIPPAGSLLLFIANNKVAGVQPALLAKHERTALQAKTTVKRVSDNTLTIDFCDLSFGKTFLKDQHVYNAADTLFKHYGFKNGNPWNTSVQFRDRTIARDTFSKGTGFTATFYFTIAQNFDFTSFKAVVERPGLWHVLINDKPVFPITGKWWLDREFKVFEIWRYLKVGQNKVALVADKMTVHSEIEPVYILGNFSLAPAEKGWLIQPPVPLSIGSWKEQGIPMYGQEVSYTKKITVPVKSKEQYQVQLGKWEGTVAAVFVNNQLAGVIGYPPYNCNITSFLKPGNNTVEVRVVGSLKNLLGPHHNNPKPGLASPWHWRNIKGYPSGKDYNIYNYGLFEDYQISVTL